VLAAAKAECKARGWPWREPVRVTDRLFRFSVDSENTRDDPRFVFSRDRALGACRAGCSAVTAKAGVQNRRCWGL
jgi:hypothetical protein